MTEAYESGAGKRRFVTTYLKWGWSETVEDAEANFDEQERVSDAEDSYMKDKVYQFTDPETGIMEIADSFDYAVWLNGGGIFGMEVVINPKESRANREAYWRELIEEHMNNAFIYWSDGRAMTLEETVELLTEYPLVSWRSTIPAHRLMSDFMDDAEIQQWARTLFDTTISKRVYLVVQEMR